MFVFFEDIATCGGRKAARRTVGYRYIGVEKQPGVGNMHLLTLS
jgi:hypothetical protein